MKDDIKTLGTTETQSVELLGKQDLEEVQKVLFIIIPKSLGLQNPLGIDKITGSELWGSEDKNKDNIVNQSWDGASLSSVAELKNKNKKRKKNKKKNKKMKSNKKFRANSNSASFVIDDKNENPASKNVQDEEESSSKPSIGLKIGNLEAGDRAIQIGRQERSQTDTFKDSIKILEKRFAILANLPEDSELKEQYKDDFEQAKYNRDKYKGNITICDEQTNTFVLKNRAHGDPIFQIKNEGTKVDIKSQNLDKDINMVKTLEALREVSGGRPITMYDCSDQETALKVLLYGRMMNLNVRISDEVAEKFNMGSEAFKKLAREISSCSPTQAREAIDDEKFNKNNALGQEILESLNLKSSNALSNTEQLTNRLTAVNKKSKSLSGAKKPKDLKTVLGEETGQSKQVIIAHQQQQEEEKQQNENEEQQVQAKAGDGNENKPLLTIIGRPK